MQDRVRFWWLALRGGAGSLNSAAGWLGLVVLVLGVAAGITVPLVFHFSPWLTAVAIMAVLVVMVLQGSYGAWAETDAQRKDALADAKSRPPSPVHAPTFWDNRGTVSGNEITNTYNATGPAAPGGSLIRIDPGSAIGESLVSVEYGNGPPAPVPEPFLSAPDERARLYDQLLALADTVETVMSPWGQPREVIAQQMGVPPGEFMARMTEIRSERSRIDGEATARYNSECRSAVVQVYGHARLIGFADADLERIWRTRLGVAAAQIPARLRAVAIRIGI